MSDTLVLNRNYYAIHILDWQRAISLLYQGHAEAVDDNLQTYNYDDWRSLSADMKDHPGGYVHTSSYRIAVPDVIKLTRYDRLPRAEVKFTRRNIYEHYNYKCCYCGKKFSTKELNLDHVIPSSKGGKTDWTNIVTACIPCNSRKADYMPEEVGMKLLVQPSRPRWKGHKLLMKVSVRVKPSWQKLIDAKYWDSELKS
jgi:5-methylcytosine-specific restriction endonuclease McrA